MSDRSLPRLGLYQHYKGRHYRAIAVATLVDTISADDPDVVVYRPDGSGETYVRRVTEWEQELEWSDGERRPRFRFVEPQ